MEGACAAGVGVGVSSVVATGDVAGAGAGFDTSATTATTNGEGGIGVFLGEWVSCKGEFCSHGCPVQCRTRRETGGW